jgi:hypothetical protein
LKKPVFLKKVGKSGDRKCVEDWGKSFIELRDAKQFLRIPGDRVFQQPQDLPMPNLVSDYPAYQEQGPT